MRNAGKKAVNVVTWIQARSGRACKFVEHSALNICSSNAKVLQSNQVGPYIFSRAWRDVFPLNLLETNRKGQDVYRGGIQLCVKFAPFGQTGTNDRRNKFAD